MAGVNRLINEHDINILTSSDMTKHTLGSLKLFKFANVTIYEILLNTWCALCVLDKHKEGFNGVVMC